MSVRLATVFLLVLALASPWPELTHAAATGHAGIAFTGVPAAGSAKQEANIGSNKGNTSHSDCHGTMSLRAGADVAMPDQADSAGSTAGSITHDCCAAGCDCGCLTTAAFIAVTVSTEGIAPALVTGFTLRATTPVAMARRLRPPIHG